MLYIFTIKESVLGICDEDHLKENVEKIWNESRENGEENDVVVYCVEKINSVGFLIFLRILLLFSSLSLSF